VSAEIRKLLTSDLACLGYIATAKLALHLAYNDISFTLHSDFFVDLGSQHRDWGFSNATPFGPALYFMSRFIIWDAAFTLRVVPAIMGTTVIVLIGLTTRVMGGGRFGVCLAALAAAIAPLSFRTSNNLHSSSFEIMICAITLFFVARILAGDRKQLWLAVGFFCGLGMLSKITMGLFVAGLGVGILVTPARSHLRTRWPWFAAVLGVLVFCPYLIWHHHNGWPVIGYITEQRAVTWSTRSHLRVMLLHIIGMNPINLPLLLGGLAFYFAHPDAKRFRALGWIYVVTMVILAITRGRPNFGAAAYTPLVIGGARITEIALARTPWSRLRAPIISVMITVGVAFAPLALKILSPSQTRRYTDDYWGILTATLGPNFKKVPGICSDHHYRRFVEIVARVYGEIPADVREETSLFISQPPEAAAVNALGRQYGLPRAYSDTRTTYRKGPAGVPLESMIIAAQDRHNLEKLYGEVTEVARIPSRHVKCDGFQSPDVVLYSCRRRLLPVRGIWAGLISSKGNFSTIRPPWWWEDWAAEQPSAREIDQRAGGERRTR
jgi:4-amino-4-deoxy-L-arabinose transferase-like glycosyltransferase